MSKVVKIEKSKKLDYACLFKEVDGEIIECIDVDMLSFIDKQQYLSQSETAEELPTAVVVPFSRPHSS